MKSIVENLYECLETPKKLRWGTTIQFIIFLMIILNIIGMSLDTVQELHNSYYAWFDFIEIITVSFFMFELILRYISIGYKQEYKGWKGRIKFTFTPFILIDIISILPTFLTFFGFNSSFLRILRLFRVFKLLRVSKVSSFERALKRVFVTDRENLLMTFASIGIILIILTIIVYFVENNAQPKIFSSIPQTLWWAVVTLSTVGYGDMYPITVFGRIITAIITMIGIAFYAIPGSLFTVALIEEIKMENAKKHELS
ncbi:MAG: ion transporter [Sulfuricurvum sp.]|uniref:ion transporter n=1 Tax=Sulfuricurvum sp. TaxID=2025608 RepID=UPI00260303EA|nr:ion transporter [Sulfuricurvum sp.]MDD2829183.1 ion transporter [Sulfuricurvum sp.]MDD4949016.1 ion transporter [Sulfuricurvum sp.]